MQTICAAEVLGMEREVSSERNISKHRDTKLRPGKRNLRRCRRKGMKSWQSVKRPERMTETLREESKDLQLRKQTLEEDIENLSESLHVKAEGIVKGTAQGVADWFTGKSKSEG